MILSSIDKMAKKLYSEELICKDATEINRFEAATLCHLILLDENLSVYVPLSSEKRLHEIISKYILHIVSNEVVESAGSLQLCTRQAGGRETAVYAANTYIEDTSMLVAFNSLNRECYTAFICVIIR